MKKIIYLGLIIAGCNSSIFTMHNKKESDDFIRRIAIYSRLSKNINLVTDGKKINIVTDEDGKVTAEVYSFLRNQPRVRTTTTSKNGGFSQVIEDATQHTQTIILYPNGTNEIINHETGHKN